MAPRRPIIPCELLPETKTRIDSYVDALRHAAPDIGTHGLNPEQFWSSGIFHGAIEQIRGKQAASMEEKRIFVAEILNYLQNAYLIRNWSYEGGGERHDYKLTMPNGRITIIEAKGCLDGNNTNIFERPPQADEFLIWSLCQNPGSSPRHNAWSGIHTRLGAEIIHRKQRVDGLIIWDMVCGTIGRPCPKLAQDATRATQVTAVRSVPPPCIYLFPRSIPDARNNPTPPCWRLEEVQFLHSLWNAFKGNEGDVVEVQIEAQMKGANVQRRTHLFRAGTELASSKWTTIKRAR